MNPHSKTAQYLQLVRLSESMNERISEVEKKISGLSVDEISILGDIEKKCFWCNIYNAVVRKEMKFHNRYPKNTLQKIRFFYRTNLSVAGHNVSLQKIEHSILRRGRPSFGMGYIKLPQISNFKKRVQPNELDNRIHFLLNCGAKSCPRVRPLTKDNYECEVENLAESYIQRETVVNKSNIIVPRIFLWYLGDFDGRRGVKNTIRQYLDEETEDKNIEFDSYDWSRTDVFFHNHKSRSRSSEDKQSD